MNCGLKHAPTLASPDNGAVETIQHRLARYVAVALILGVIGALFVRQQLASGGADAQAVGLLDTRSVVVGAPVPDFVLRTLDGHTARLTAYRGKTIVLNFWASWCVPCREEMANFASSYAARGGDSGDLVILAVDYLPLDGERDVRRFVDGFASRGQPLTFPILLDTTEGAVAARYGVAPRGARQAALPVSFVIDRDGVLRSKVLGPITNVLGDRLRDAETQR